MNNPDQKNTRFRSEIRGLYKKLGIEPVIIGFKCSKLKDCFPNYEQAKGGFITGTWTYTGSSYGMAKISGRKYRILVIGIDRGGKDNISGESFQRTQRSYREACEKWVDANGHMSGVSLLLKELLDNKCPKLVKFPFG